MICLVFLRFFIEGQRGRVMNCLMFPESFFKEGQRAGDNVFGFS